MDNILFGTLLEYSSKRTKNNFIMKKFYTICLLVLCVGAFAQQAGKAGELLKNEVKDNENKTQQNTRHSNNGKNGTSKPNTRKATETGRRNHNNSDFRWNYNYGTSEVFLRIPENGYFTVEIGDQVISNSTGKYRFFDLQAGSIPVSIYDGNFLIYRTRLMLRNNTRTVLDFFSDYGLYLLGNFPQQNNAYGINEWDDVWNTNYGSNFDDFNGNEGGQDYYNGVMNSQEFDNFLQTLKREASFDNTKIQFVNATSQHANFTSMQIYELLNTLSFENSKLDLAKQLFSK